MGDKRKVLSGMNGVEILSEQTIYQVDCLWWLFFLFIGIGFVIGLIAAIKEWVDFGWNTYMLWLMLMTTIVGAWVGVLGIIFSKHETDVVDHIEYKVTVSEDVNFNEFMNKYEVVDQDGKIYTVKDRE